MADKNVIQYKNEKICFFEKSPGDWPAHGAVTAAFALRFTRKKTTKTNKKTMGTSYHRKGVRTCPYYVIMLGKGKFIGEEYVAQEIDGVVGVQLAVGIHVTVLIDREFFGKQYVA